MTEPSFTPNPAYFHAQMEQALETARSHESPEARKRALGRIEKIGKVALGIAKGTLKVGSRTPVAGMPIWVTPEVIRGGFATGEAMAGGPLSDDEIELAQQLGVAPQRAAIFGALLAPNGFPLLQRQLADGTYRVEVPEHAALLVVAWLAHHGRVDEAASLVSEIAPLAPALRFHPPVAALDERPPGVVARQSVGETRAILHQRQENERIATMRESLQVWVPLSDDALSLWLETTVDGVLDVRRPDGWQTRARELIERYDRLAETHTRVKKTHRSPKENLARLLIATREATAGPLSGPTLGRLQHSVDSMVAKRGAPGSPEHRDLRSWQAAIAARPGRHRLAVVVADRMADLDQRRGVTRPDRILEPVTATEAATHAVPAGAAVTQAPIVRIVKRALEATPEALVRSGVIGSSEVLAELTPEIAANAVADTYPTSELQAVMRATYVAFSRRRSLLLVDLEHQARMNELPWVAIVDSDRDGSADASRLALDRLAGLAVSSFPGTLIPSPLVTQLSTLAKDARLDLPLVEELAADIFMERFSVKFLAAAQLAGRLLRGSLYERYYGIDYAEVMAIRPEHRPGLPAVPDFDALCWRRSSVGSGPRPSSRAAGNGTVIEQAQILTTHNLATLLGPAPDGLALPLDPAELAAACFDHTLSHVSRIDHNPRPLRTIKNAAYSWRNLVFFLSLLEPPRLETTVAAIESRAAGRPAPVRRRIEPALDGLRFVAEGGSFGEHEVEVVGRPARRFTGWTVGPHWMADAPATDD